MMYVKNKILYRPKIKNKMMEHFTVFFLLLLLVCFKVSMQVKGKIVKNLTYLKRDCISLLFLPTTHQITAKKLMYELFNLRGHTHIITTHIFTIMWIPEFRGKEVL